MKKSKKIKLSLKKTSVSNLDINTVSGGGTIPAGTLGCTGFCSVGGCQSANNMCTAHTILCENGPSEFGAGGCTYNPYE